MNLPTFWVKLDFLLAIFTIRLKYARGSGGEARFVGAIIQVLQKMMKMKTVMKRRTRPRRNWNERRNQQKLNQTVSDAHGLHANL